MREYKYDKTLSRDFDDALFDMACKKIERCLPGARKRKLITDPLDGSRYQGYDVPGGEIMVSNDWMVGAVFVESDIDLTELFPEAY